MIFQALDTMGDGMIPLEGAIKAVSEVHKRLSRSQVPNDLRCMLASLDGAEVGAIEWSSLLAVVCASGRPPKGARADVAFRCWAIQREGCGPIPRMSDSWGVAPRVACVGSIVS